MSPFDHIFSREQTIELKRDYQQQSTKTWDHVAGLKAGVATRIRTGVPFLAEGKLGFDGEATYEHRWGAGERSTSSVSVAASVAVPPHRATSVSIEARRVEVDVPFTATVAETKGDRMLRRRTREGVFRHVQVSDFHVVYGSFQPLSPPSRGSRTPQAEPPPYEEVAK